jgi:hypothetical protein
MTTNQPMQRYQGVAERLARGERWDSLSVLAFLALATGDSFNDKGVRVAR